LESVEINFDDEIRVLILLSSLPEAYDGLVMAVSNSCETRTLKFDDAVGVLSEEAHKKSSGLAETSGSALSVDRRGRPMNREEKMTNPDPNQGEVFPNLGVPGVGGAVRSGIFRGTATRRRMEKAKAKRKIPHVTE